MASPNFQHMISFAKVFGINCRELKTPTTVLFHSLHPTFLLHFQPSCYYFVRPCACTTFTSLEYLYVTHYESSTGILMQPSPSRFVLFINLLIILLVRQSGRSGCERTKTSKKWIIIRVSIWKANLLEFKLLVKNTNTLLLAFKSLVITQRLIKLLVFRYY